MGLGKQIEPDPWPWTTSNAHSSEACHSLACAWFMKEVWSMSDAGWVNREKFAFAYIFYGGFIRNYQFFSPRYCRTHNVRVCLYIVYIACGSASLYIKTLYFFLTVLALSAAATIANIKIRYDAKTRYIWDTLHMCVLQYLKQWPRKASASIVLASRASGCLLYTQTPKNQPSGHPNFGVSNFLKCKFQACNWRFFTSI